jgi:hypothetical protein
VALQKHIGQTAGLVYALLVGYNLYIIALALYNPLGQTTISVIGNPSFATFHLLPLFLLLAFTDKIPQVLGRWLVYMTMISLPLAFLLRSPGFVNAIMFFFIILFPYIKNQRQKIFYTGSVLVVGLLSSLAFGYRMMFISFIVFGIMLALHVTSGSIESFKAKARPVIIFCFTAPFVFLFIAISTGFSIFNISNEFEFLAQDEHGSEDTRTFVWKETLVDMKKSHALVTGKGMTGTIKTELPSFVDPTVVRGRRQFVEAGFLENLKRGGIVLAILNLALLLLAMWRVLTLSRNRLTVLAAMAISVHFVLSFIGHNPLFTAEYVVYWVLVGVCLSRRWNTYSDDEIYQIITTRNIHTHGNTQTPRVLAHRL